jgi:hypothetical protein
MDPIYTKRFRSIYRFARSCELSIWSKDRSQQKKDLEQGRKSSTKKTKPDCTLYRTSSVPLFLFRSASRSCVISISSPSPVPTLDPRRRDKAFIGQSRSRFVSANIKV